MIKELYTKILQGEDVRKNLIELRKELKEGFNKKAFLYQLAGDYEELYKLLQHEDAKVRKNIALIMGELMEDEFAGALYKAYTAEEKLFVKADYLKAISYLDYRKMLPQLKERLEELNSREVAENEQKHIGAEKKILNEMILMIEPPTKHKFTGFDKPSSLILLTNRDHQFETIDEIKSGEAKAFNAGVLVKTDNLGEILKLRTYADLFFRVPHVATAFDDPDNAAKKLAKGELLSFLRERHEGDAPFYFRIELKSKMPLDKKSEFTKKLGMGIERYSKGKLINSTSNYECEIRLIENKEGHFNVLLKLYTIEDSRFVYRRNTLPTSIAPYRAALIAKLAKPYMKEEAQVLDPFCGVATMLIEREKVQQAKVMYGIDLVGEAIDGAIENANYADTDIYLINKDFFEFEHKYKMDEIFTNMPTAIGRKTKGEIADLYYEFFRKAEDILEDNGRIIMYSREKEFVEYELRDGESYELVKCIPISRKEDAYLYIIDRK